MMLLLTKTGDLPSITKCRIRRASFTWQKQNIIQPKYESRKSHQIYTLMITVPSAFSRNSGRKKNSGINSLTSVADSNDERRHVVAKEWKVRSGISKLRSIKKPAIITIPPLRLLYFFHVLTMCSYLLCSSHLHISHNKPCSPSPRTALPPFSPPQQKKAFILISPGF